MASLNMNGPFPATKNEVDRQVTRKSPGNYGLDRKRDEGTFHVDYVGRSDTDLNAELKSRITGYKRFKYSYALSPKAAFEKECHNYHDFGGRDELDNEYHPARPAGTSWKCPRCNIFG